MNLKRNSTLSNAEVHKISQGVDPDGFFYLFVIIDIGLFSLKLFWAQKRELCSGFESKFLKYGQVHGQTNKKVS